MKSAYIEDLKTSTTLQVVHDLYSGDIRGCLILSPLMGA